MTHRLAALAAALLSLHAPPGATRQTDGRVWLDASSLVPGSLTSASASVHVALAWYAASGDGSRVMLAASADAGASFEAPVALPGAPPTAGAVRPALQVTGDATTAAAVHVAWPARVGTGAGVNVASRRAGRAAQHWEALPDALPRDARVAALAIDRGGATHGLWVAGREILYARVTRNAVSRPVRLDDAATGCALATIAVDAAGAVHVAWHRGFDDGAQEWAYRRQPTAGAAFGPPVRTSHDTWGFTGCPADAPSFSIDGDGNVRMAFQATLGGPAPRPMFLADRSADGATFVPRSHLTPTGFDDARRPQLVPDGEGGLSMVWDGVRNGQRYVMVRHSLAPQVPGAGLAADWIRPGPPVVLDRTGDGAMPVITPVPGGMFIAWISGSGDASQVTGLRLSTDQLCGQAPIGR